MSAEKPCNAGPSAPLDDAPALYPQFILHGDSITQNSTLSLQAYLATQYSRRLDVVNRGFSGYTAPLGLYALGKFLPDAATAATPPVKLLALWYGANDARLPTNRPNDQHVSVDAYVTALEGIVRHPALVAHGTRVVLLTPPPIDEHQLDSSDPRTPECTAQYAAAARDLAGRLGLPLVDVWSLFMAEAGGSKWDADKAALPGSRSAAASSALRALLCDGLHLSVRGYRLVFEELMRVIRKDLPALAPENLPLVVRYQGPGFFYERYSAVNQLKLEGYPTLPEDEERVAQSWEEMEQARLVEEAMQGTHQTTANQTV